MASMSDNKYAIYITYNSGKQDVLHYGDEQQCLEQADVIIAILDGQSCSTATHQPTGLLCQFRRNDQIASVNVTEASKK